MAHRFECLLRGMATAALAALLATLLATSALLPAGAAWAQGWRPERNVEIVVGLTAGSSQDRTGRALQKTWQDTGALGVTSTVVNRVGGGGQVAWTHLSQHAGDAHYVLVVSPAIVTIQITGASRLTFADFTPLGLLGGQYLAVAVRAESAVASGRELMERLKRDPYTLSVGVNTAGSSLHIFAGMIVKAAGGDPKKGRFVIFQGAELMTAALGGHVDAIVTVASNIQPHVESGKLRMLAVAAPRRLGGALAAVPTWKEQGLDLIMTNWSGVMGAKGLAPQQIAYWDRILAAAVVTADWKVFLDTNQWSADYLNSAEFLKYLRAEDAKLRIALTDLGLAKQ